MAPSPGSQYVACDECGVCMPRAALARHTCERERRVHFQLLEQRSGIESFERDFGAWLKTADGRFALYYAEHRRPRTTQVR